MSRVFEVTHLAQRVVHVALRCPGTLLAGPDEAHSVTSPTFCGQPCGSRRPTGGRAGDPTRPACGRSRPSTAPPPPACTVPSAVHSGISGMTGTNARRPHEPQARRPRRDVSSPPARSTAHIHTPPDPWTRRDPLEGVGSPRADLKPRSAPHRHAPDVRPGCDDASSRPAGTRITRITWITRITRFTAAGPLPYCRASHTRRDRPGAVPHVRRCPVRGTGSSASGRARGTVLR